MATYTNTEALVRTTLGSLSSTRWFDEWPNTIPDIQITTAPAFTPTMKEQHDVNTTIHCVGVIEGYLGQIAANGTIIWQSKPKKTEEKARRAAVKHRDRVIADLFGGE